MDKLTQNKKIAVFSVNVCGHLQLAVLDPVAGVRKLFLERTDRKHFEVCGPSGLSQNYSSRLL